MADNEYRICAGTIRPCIVRVSPLTVHQFGRFEPDLTKPTLTPEVYEKASGVVNALNNGEIPLERGLELLEQL